MDEQTTEADPQDLSAKIARLVQERGWNQEEFARIARLNRHTVRQILLSGERRLRNSTLGACARALGLSVNDLRTQPLGRLLPRMGGAAPAPVDPEEGRRRLYERAAQPELRGWLERNPERALRLTPEESEELLALQDGRGPLNPAGVEAFVTRLERRRALVHQLHAVAGTEYLDLLEQFLGLLYEKVRSNGGRG